MCRHKGWALVVVWKLTNNIDSHFLDHFQPIPGVTFVESVPQGTPADKLYHNCGTCVGYRPDYTWLKLNAYTQAIVDDCARSLRPYVAMHVRRTDHVRLAQSRGRYTTDEMFFNYVAAHAPLVVFVATDNCDTQNMLLDKYGQERIALHSRIEPSDAIRQTSLQDAIVDLYVCIEAKHFMGSGWSSLSDFIMANRKQR